MQTKPILAMAMVSMMIVPLALAESGKGKNGNGGGSTTGVAGTDTRLIAKMLPIPGGQQDPLFEGHVVRRTQGTSRDEFEARVEVPESFFGANGHPDSVSLDLVANTIQCVMVLDQVNQVTGVVEYKTSIRSRNGSTAVNRAGSCNPQGIPNMQVGNSASADFGNGNILQGRFNPKR
ncbi:MAG: hypothetical protein CAF45_003745 [Nitrospira sp. CG24E]|nr:MAG: hypothetical protein CAF45_003745 [Nitrospira sp. CG24E]